MRPAGGPATWVIRIPVRAHVARRCSRMLGKPLRRHRSWRGRLQLRCASSGAGVRRSPPRSHRHHRLREQGTDADYAHGRLIEPGISKRTLERMGGQLFVVSGRVHGKVWIAVNAYLPGRTNSEDALREDLLGHSPNST